VKLGLTLNLPFGVSIAKREEEDNHMGREVWGWSLRLGEPGSYTPYHMLVNWLTWTMSIFFFLKLLQLKWDGLACSFCCSPIISNGNVHLTLLILFYHIFGFKIIFHLSLFSKFMNLINHVKIYNNFYFSIFGFLSLNNFFCSPELFLGLLGLLVSDPSSQISFCIIFF
jgi:hypothetical protein